MVATPHPLAVQAGQLFAHGEGPHEQTPEGLLGDDPAVFVAEAVEEAVHGDVDGEEEVGNAEQLVNPLGPRPCLWGPLLQIHLAG